MLGQTKSTIHIPSLMNSGKILVVNLSKGRLGEEPSHLLGALFASAFAQAADARANIPESERRDFTLYVDEFQNFATSAFASMLSEARKWRLSLVLANQFLGQLSDTLRQAVLGNVGTLIVFRVSAEDAAPLAPELGIGKALALTDTANYQAWIKLTQHGVPSEPRLLATFPPNFSIQGKLAAVQARTRARFARPRAIVEERNRAFVRY